MSGQEPGSWFVPGKKVVYNGKEEILKDYFHTSHPCHNSDVLNIEFESGVTVEAYDTQFMQENPGLIRFTTFEEVFSKRRR